MTDEQRKQQLSHVASAIVALCGEGFNQKQAAHMAWRGARLAEKLSTGEVWFQYYKGDGSLRAAHGTLCPALIPGWVEADWQRKRKADHRYVNYYDLDRQAWRRCRKDLITGTCRTQTELFDLNQEDDGEAKD